MNIKHLNPTHGDYTVHGNYQPGELRTTPLRQAPGERFIVPRVYGWSRSEAGFKVTETLTTHEIH
ncbi:MAG: hypothetical protein IPP36_04990 [Nitrosomonadales bacterium]|nr:hypothetical protein [Nitrosomonadales bacterium]